MVQKDLYMIAIELPNKLAISIRKLQLEFAQKYESNAALAPPVHITFKPPFHLDEIQLLDCIKKLNEFTSNEKSFLQTLKGFDFFEKNKVLFIKVVPDNQLKQLHQRFMTFYPDKGHNYTPHITVGYRNLTTEQFKQIMADYSTRNFSADFFVTGLSLWKRAERRWVNYQMFPFKDYME